MSAARIGRYEIMRPLGRGAMGVVYLARDPQIERVIALKTVRFDGPHQSFGVDEAKARFLKEARISGRLQHPNIVTIYDVGEDQGTLFLAMEYISGGSLQQRLADTAGSLTVVDRLRVVAEVADALAHAHQRGVIHRDIKPANIMLTEQLGAKVTDFGIGKLVTGDADLTSTGQMVGSPAYMSPEQIKGEKLDVRSDIFSLGVVLYQTLTLKKPFPADTLTTLVYQILNEEPVDPLEIRSDLPPEIVPIITRCLAKKRDERYADAAEMAEAIRAILGIAPVGSTAALSESKVAKAREKAAQQAAAQQADMRTVMIDMTGRPMTAQATGRMPPAPAPQAPPATPAEVPVPAAPAVAPVPMPPPVEASGGRGSRVERTGVPPPLPKKAPGPSGGLLVAVAAVVVAALGGGGFWLVRSGVLGSAAPLPTPVPTAVPLPTPTPEPPPTPVPTEDVSGTVPPGTGTVEPTPEAEPTPAPTAAASATPAPRPTRTPRPKPTPRPVAATTPAPARPTPTPVPARVDQTLVVRRFVKISVEPAQARVYLDGRYVGIADDWDDSGGGALITFLLEGRRRIRLAYPGKRDLVVDVVVSATSTQDVGEIDRTMDDGSPSGPTGPDGKLNRPSHKTVGPLRLVVEPPEARLVLDGKDMGPVSQWKEQDLALKDNAVHEVILEAPGYESRAYRVLCALSAREARATIKEKLKRM